MLVKLNIVNKNHKVLFQTRITHGDEDHTLHVSGQVSCETIFTAHFFL